MSLIPAFEIGVWNTWILGLAFLWVQFGALTFLNRIYKGAYKRAAAPSSAEKIDRFVILVMIIAFVYSAFVPLKLGASWFYTGIPIFSLGLVMLVATLVNFAATPLDEAITRGLYRYSRHPMYLAMLLVFTGIGIASASWVLLLFTVIFFILINIEATSEEQFCQTTYGYAYREYMRRTPRWIGIQKSEQSVKNFA